MFVLTRTHEHTHARGIGLARRWGNTSRFLLGLSVWRKKKKKLIHWSWAVTITLTGNKVTHVGIHSYNAHTLVFILTTHIRWYSFLQHTYVGIHSYNTHTLVFILTNAHTSVFIHTRMHKHTRSHLSIGPSAWTRCTRTRTPTRTHIYVEAQ